MSIASFSRCALHALMPIAVTAGLLALSATQAAAVPAYAVQTGQACSACHIGAFGPQLTPFGREFKLEGYTMRAGNGFTAPVSAMAVFSFLHTSKDQAAPPAPHYGRNNNGGLDQASLFLAGGYGHFGGFFQTTYDGVGRDASWDNLDLRAITKTAIAGKDLLLGATLNNNPGVQDPWNTMAAWGFPYTSSDLMPGPGAAPLSAGNFAQTVLGTSVYAYWNEAIYAEAGVYWMPGNGFLRTLGSHALDAGGLLDGAAPYFRAAYQKDYGNQNFEVGVFGLFSSMFPGGDKSTGTSDHYADYGFDGSYQFMGDGSGDNIYTLNLRYTHETQDLAASYLLGGATYKSNSLDDIRLDGSYYWHNTYGGTISFFNTWGSADPLLYAGNSAFKPDSQGFTFQIDTTLFGREASSDPRFNMRVGLQYVVYTRFNGAASNYDGLGRNASDNNTLRIFTWFAL